ncbi:MAG: DUF4118 domain-containing protein, partial [Chloroflexota bacterium]
MHRRRLQRVAILLAVALPSLVLASLIVSLLRSSLGVPNASVVYLAAVVATAVVAGTPGAITATVGAVLVYDFFFVDPLYTFPMADPAEWLNAVLLLFVGL